MHYEVALEEAAPRILLASRHQTTFADLPATIGALLGSVWDFVRSEEISAGFNIVYYPNEGSCLTSPQGAPIEAGVEISANTLLPEELPTDLIITSTPGGRVAVVTHWGSYNGLPQAHEALHQWCKDNQHTSEGASWEIYGHWSDDPSQVRTDIVYLLQS